MAGTIRLEDMRLFSAVAAAKSFTAAAARLGVPKQTLSRRVAELEDALDAQLLHRTTRRLFLTEVGAAYAERCAELVRAADEANQAVTNARQAPKGLLRITADPVFGEAFLGELVIEYARRWPEVQVEVVLTRRNVDLVEEGFDVAFRVGHVSDPALTAAALGPARVRYCASPAYVARRGSPRTPEELAGHDCLLVLPEGSLVRWPVPGPKAVAFLQVAGRLRFNSFAMAHAAARAGLGIGLFPEFACAEDLRRRRLVAVLGGAAVEVGSVWLVHPTHRYLTARIRTFVDLATRRFAAKPPWLGRRCAPRS